VFGTKAELVFEKRLGQREPLAPHLSQYQVPPIVEVALPQNGQVVIVIVFLL
jgi:hypothetical protein